MRKHFVQAQLLHEHRRQAVTPIVEVAHDQQRRAVRDRLPDAVRQGLDLAATTAGEQAQVHDEAVHLGAADVDARVQQAALLQTMVGDVLVLVIEDVKARQQGIAVIGAGTDGIAAIGRLQAQCGGQRFVLGVQDRGYLVASLDLLQEDQVRTQAIQAQAQIVEGLAPAQGRAAFVDVVADYANKRHRRYGALSKRAKPRHCPACPIPAAGGAAAHGVGASPAYFISLRRCASGCAARAIASRRLPTARRSTGTAHAGSWGRRSRRGWIRRRPSW
ncbi:Uncharacterised protein [Bordetella pertussis]|nr:Uncharacterised protein [Bordetella pertussis]